MDAYSKDLRLKIIESWLEGEGKPVEIAERFKVHLATVYRYIKLYQTKGSVEVTKKQTRRGKISLEGDQFLKQQIQKKPETTLAELKQKFFKKFGIEVSEFSISRHLKMMKISRKKKRYMLNS